MTAVQMERATAPSGARQARRPRRRAGLAGYLFVSGYTALLLAFGVFPTGYSIYLAFTNSLGQFTGLGQFVKVVGDFRFGPAFADIGSYLAMWLVLVVVMTVVTAVILRSRVRPGLSSVLRFLFYLPGALAGVASVLVWLFMLSPSVSPAAGLLRALGLGTFEQVIAPGNLPVILVLIAFWTGAGGWIVVMYGALNNIPAELLEAARIDGASVLKTARYVQIPLLRKWIAYMLILAFATGTQLFVEPQLVGEASLGQVSDSWSPNQLAYQYAFHSNNFNDASAVSIYLLILGLACAALVVFRSGLFEAGQ